MICDLPGWLTMIVPVPRLTRPAFRTRIFTLAAMLLIPVAEPEVSPASALCPRAWTSPEGCGVGTNSSVGCCVRSRATP
jgi:hypothetical protein